MRLLFLLPFLFSLLFAEDFSAGFQGGTTGIGPAAAFRVSEVVSLRFGALFLSFNREQKVDAITYDLDVSLKWIPVIMDWNPGGSIFRMSGGLLFNNSSADASYIPEVSITYGGHTYSPANVGEVTGKVKMQSMSPYLGIGLGRSTGDSGGVRVLVDAGIAFTGFDVSLNHTGGNLSPALEEQLMEDLNMEADSLEDSLEDWKVYPVLSAGLYYSW